MKLKLLQSSLFQFVFWCACAYAHIFCYYELVLSKNQNFTNILFTFCSERFQRSMLTSRIHANVFMTILNAQRGLHTQHHNNYWFFYCPLKFPQMALNVVQITSSHCIITPICSLLHTLGLARIHPTSHAHTLYNVTQRKCILLVRDYDRNNE